MRPDPGQEVGGHPDPRDEIVENLKPMRAFAMSLTRDLPRADDLVQETVVKAWTNLHRYEPGTNMRAWLFTILRNSFYSERRKARRESAHSFDEDRETVAQKPDHDWRLALADFRKMFEELPEDQREALILVGALGFSYEEAAETCNCAVGTIKSRASRGRARLVELMGMRENEAFELTDRATVAVIAQAARNW
jgi:RNA polymerase sigma-70 factor (ECF subfamily)